MFERCVALDHGAPVVSDLFDGCNPLAPRGHRARQVYMPRTECTFASLVES